MHNSERKQGTFKNFTKVSHVLHLRLNFFLLSNDLQKKNQVQNSLILLFSLVEKNHQIERKLLRKNKVQLLRN